MIFMIAKLSYTKRGKEIKKSWMFGYIERVQSYDDINVVVGCLADVLPDV